MLRTAAILGLLAAIGPFAVDMYLPAFPAIEKGLGTSVSSAQMTLTVYFIAFGIAQLFYGPFSDQVGRKPPLYLGLAIFAIGTIGCALSPTIEWLLVSRFIQGIGGAVVMVVPRAIIRDMYTGPQATRLMAMVMLVISVSPMLAPLAGSWLILIADWRAIFWVLFAAALIGIVITGYMQPETLEKHHRVPVNVRTLFRGCRILLTDPTFMGVTFIGGFGMASFFVFVANASFIYTGQFGLSATQFSLAFAVNAIGFFATSQLAAGLGEKFGMERVVSLAVLGFAGFSLLLVALTYAGFGSLLVTISFLFLANACLGFVIPTTMVIALDNHGDIAGLASSLGGTLQMLAGGLFIVVMGPFFDGTTFPMVVAIALCAIASTILTWRILPNTKSTQGERT
ncbi:Bcr/CflA family efflux MFS transporter [Sneathiella sp. DP05]|uniref:Bcr/CflA family efflux transporter n=2 Tax=Sneathiella litorea TaxID=2606216 RepID=A0A6L8WB38_9PROT|nr:Bcr/CflA family efflux MFS transporter [Sneathiella litorea]